MTGVARRVEAAGGIVERDGRIAVVHRPRYDDWSLPKGKLDRGETFEQAALREVHEETGLVCELGDGARARPLPRQQGPRQARALLADGRGLGIVRAERRGRRAALGPAGPRDHGC